MLNVKITLTPEARAAAADMRIKRGLDCPPDFEGPEFLGAKSCGNKDGFVIVAVEDGTVYAYNERIVARVRMWELPKA